jgi:hypothetical protein
MTCVRGLLAGLAVCLAGSALGAATASAAAPALHLDMESAETMKPGQLPIWYFSISNVGNAPFSAPIVFKQTFPEGMQPAAPEEGLLPPGSVCEIAGNTLTCTIPIPEAPYKIQHGGYILMTTRTPVEPGAVPGERVSHVTLEGGGAYEPIHKDEVFWITSETKPFGFRDFEATILNEDGSEALQAGSAPGEVSTVFQVNTSAQAWFGIDSFTFPGAIEQFRNSVAQVPAGIVGNPNLIPQCEASQLQGTGCPPDSQVGWIFATLLGGLERVPLYNMVPGPGYPAQFGFSFVYVPSLLSVSVRPDYGLNIENKNPVITLPLSMVGVTFWGVPASESHDTERTPECLPGYPQGMSGNVCPTDAPHKAFLRLPTSCPDHPLDWTLEADSYIHPGVMASITDTTPAPVGCNQLEFTPTIEARPTTNVAEAPTGLEFNLHLPQNDDPEGLAEANLRTTVVRLPEGMTANPAFAAGLDACSSAEIGLTTPIGVSPPRFTPQEPRCPDASKLGPVEVESPLLENPLKGAAYLAEPYDNPYESFLMLYIVVEDRERGVVVKLPARIEPDPQTGQIVAILEDAPQLPFEDFKLRLDAGPHAALKTPGQCGSQTASATLTPWTFPEGPVVKTADSFDIAQGVNGSPCTNDGPTLSPGFTAGTRNPRAGAYTPFTLKTVRGDGTQRIRSIDTTLPPGLLGRVSYASYCSEAALAAAANRAGRLEQASPSCPASSRLGGVNVGAGVGPSPYYAKGNVYLAGPYKGAPLSIAVVTPAVAGPFDLGTVVVRAALFVDPVTTQIRVVSDPIPSILNGIPLNVRSVAVNMDRENFTKNPTSCNPMSVVGVIGSTVGQLANVSNRFQVGGCALLGFKPKLALNLKGSTARRGHPQLHAVLTGRPDDADISYTQVTLPSTELLDQSNIRNVCTRVQFAAHSCPPSSVYGYAKAVTPLLEQPLEGPVYLRSSSNPLPDLVAELNGQIEVDLVGRLDSPKKGGGLRTTFDVVPDAPVSEFTLTMKGGSAGLLQNSVNLCRAKQHAGVLIDGQNGKTADQTPRVNVRGCGNSRKKRPHRGHR